MTTISRGAAGVAVLLTLTTVPLSANREHQVMMAELRMLQEQTQQLRQILLGLNEALTALSGRLDDQAAASRKAFADQRLLFDNLAEGVRIIREKADETNVRIATLGQDLESLRSLPFGQGQAGGPPGEPGDPEAMPDPNAPVATGATPSQLWDLAAGDYSAGQWDLAIQGFQTYLKAYPRSPRAHEAALQIGQAHYAAGRFKEAIAAYDEAIARFAGTPSVPQAYYKRGLAYDRLGQTDRARQSLEHVVQAFPDSNEAILAKQVLDGLSRRPR
jgi:tol-pal system protein YbgF